MPTRVPNQKFFPDATEEKQWGFTIPKGNPLFRSTWKWEFLGFASEITARTERGKQFKHYEEKFYSVTDFRPSEIFRAVV